MTTLRTFTSELAEVKLRELIDLPLRTPDHGSLVRHEPAQHLLCLSDFLHFRRHGESITGADYVVAEHGPWLVKFELHLDPLIDDGKIVIQSSDLGGYTQYRPMALASADLFGFNGAEIATDGARSCAPPRDTVRLGARRTRAFTHALAGRRPGIAAALRVWRSTSQSG